MNFLAGILNGLTEVWAHKLRSLLTITCVLLGVSSLVVITGLLDGLVTSWNTWFTEFGGLEKVTVTAEEVTEEQRQRVFSTITLTDAATIRRNISVARRVSPELSYEASVKRQGRFFKVYVTGVAPDALAVNRYALKEGRFITDLDNEGYEPVVVLGSSAVEALYGKNEKVLGSRIEIRAAPYTVVGVLQHCELMQEGVNVLRKKNEIIYTPVTTMQKRISGRMELDSVNVQVTDVRFLRRLTTQIGNVLRHLHTGRAGGYKIETGEEMMEVLGKSRRSYFAVGGAVAAVSLLVGGIGIMNLMLASINERLREIGVRKAIGAWGWDIFVQFLAEAITLSVLGGLFGVAVGIGVIEYLQTTMMESSPPILSLTAIAVGFSISVVIGVLSGLYPAVRASRLDPIEALRYE